ncbi:MAG: glycosyltransferase [Alphaproteobacteria bacterium]|nr:glycosyltransferase [Alphaproteobacteria bacterium]
MAKILYIFDAKDWDSRIGVAQKAREKGHEVILGLVGSGRKQQEFPNFPVLSGLTMFADVWGLLKSENPQIVHAVTLKFAFLTGLACYFRPDIRKIYTFAGLGYLFRSGSVDAALLRFFISPFLKMVFRRSNTKIIFQNPDDLSVMVRKNYVRQEDTVLIRGSGVCLEKFQPRPSDDSQIPLVLMPTRLVREKGIRVFIQAAKLLKKRGIEAKFQIAGGVTSQNPKAISKKEMNKMIKDTPVEWLGRVEDMPSLLSNAHVIVYPSYYGEGVPRVLLEACAAGRAIVTTDHPGCREAVTHDVNGLLVPVKNVLATANAIEEILRDPKKRREMEAESRKRAEAHFDILDIAAKTAALYD